MTEVHLEPRHLVMIEQMLQDFILEVRVWCFESLVHGRGLKRISDLNLVVRNEEDLHVELRKLWDAFDLRSSHQDRPVRMDSTSGLAEAKQIVRARGAPGIC